MTRVRLLARRARVRGREERYYRLWRFHARRGRRLKKGSVEQLANASARRRHGELYHAARDRRRDIDLAISKRPITQVDQAGIDLIKAEEGVVNRLYHDVLGFCTGGVGHLVRRGACTVADHRKYDHWAPHDWDVQLARDLDSFEAAVAKVFKRAKVACTQSRFNACVCLAFNIGVAGFLGSTVARLIKAGDLRGAADAFLMWVHPPVLRARRLRERALFLS